MGAQELAAAIRRRFPQTDASLEADLAACEEASYSDTILPREALKLIRKLYMHQENLAAAAKPGSRSTKSLKSDSYPTERAS
jgi:hypothetical protein